ncbi:sporulation histidine kinase inhibitor Sda [Paenibacillus sp. 1_12]
MNDEDLLEYYNLAIKHKVDRAFIELLEGELVRRDIDIQPQQEDQT